MFNFTHTLTILSSLQKTVTLHPERVRFLAIDAPIVDYVCLPLYHLTFVPLCNLSAIFREEKRNKKRDKRV